MKAAYFDQVGDPDVIRYGDLPNPVAGAGEVLVRVDAVAVNPVDAIVRSGRWPTRLAEHAVVGRDLVGTVVATGDGVTGVSPGDRVWTNSAGYGGRHGATAEFVPVERDRLYPLPAGADPVRFVATVHPGATAYAALAHRARLQEGEKLVVVGGNGGVGMCLIQVGVALGATVIAVVRDASSVRRLHELGAVRVLVADDPIAAMADAEPDGVDVIVDTSGHLDHAAAIGRLRPRGRIVLLAGRSRAELDLWTVETRELAILGFVMSGMTQPELAAAARWLTDPASHRPLELDIGAVLGFADARHAHELIESGRAPKTQHGTTGRIVLLPPADQPRPAPDSCSASRVPEPV